jgi:hypothetical protein
VLRRPKLRRRRAHARFDALALPRLVDACEERVRVARLLREHALRLVVVDALAHGPPSPPTSVPPGMVSSLIHERWSCSVSKRLGNAAAMTSSSRRCRSRGGSSTRVKLLDEVSFAHRDRLVVAVVRAAQSKSCARGPKPRA